MVLWGVRNASWKPKTSSPHAVAGSEFGRALDILPLCCTYTLQNAVSYTAATPCRRKNRKAEYKNRSARPVPKEASIGQQARLRAHVPRNQASTRAQVTIFGCSSPSTWSFVQDQPLAGNHQGSSKPSHRPAFAKDQPLAGTFPWVTSVVQLGLLLFYLFWFSGFCEASPAPPFPLQYAKKAAAQCTALRSCPFSPLSDLPSFHVKIMEGQESSSSSNSPPREQPALGRASKRAHSYSRTSGVHHSPPKRCPEGDTAEGHQRRSRSNTREFINHSFSGTPKGSLSTDLIFTFATSGLPSQRNTRPTQPRPTESCPLQRESPLPQLVFLGQGQTAEPAATLPPQLASLLPQDRAESTLPGQGTAPLPNQPRGQKGTNTPPHKELLRLAALQKGQTAAAAAANLHPHFPSANP